VTFPDFPAPQTVALADALDWLASPDWCYERKADGCRARLAGGELAGRARRYALPGELPPALARVTLDGELCRRTYYAFDMLEAGGDDLRPLPLRERKRRLAALAPLFPAWLRLIPTAPPGMSGGEYLLATLAAGGEGVCAKHLAGRYGQGWLKTKVRPSFDVVATGKAADRQSVAIAQYADGELVPCGNVAVPARAFASIRPGSVVEITAQGRTRGGRFREPAFLRLRTDKPATACTI